MYKLEITFNSLAELHAFVEAAGAKPSVKPAPSITVLPPVDGPPHAHRDPWTSAENDYIRANYAKLGASKVAGHLGRSMQSVYQQAHALGISAKRPSAKSTLRKLGKISFRSDGVYVENK